MRMTGSRPPETLAGPAAFAAALRRDYGGYLVSLGLLSLGNVLLLPLVTAYLPPADLGLYSLVTTAMVQGTTFSLLGLKFAYLYYYAHTPAGGRPALLGSTLVLAAGASLVAGAVTWSVFASPAIMARFDSRELPHAWLVVPVLTLTSVQTILLTELRAARRVWLSGGIAIVQLVLLLLGSALLVAVWGFGIAGLLAAQMSAGLLSCGVAMAFLWRHLQFRWIPRQSLALLRYGIPMMGSLMLRYSLDTLSRFFLAALVSIEAAGSFLVANTVASIFDSLLAMPFYTAWGGLVHHALRQPSASGILGRATAAATVFGSLLLLVMVVCQSWLFGLLAHDNSHDIAALFTLLVMARAVQLVRSPLTSGILATGRTGWATRNSLFGLLVFLILFYPMVLQWQAEGLAAALLLAHIAATATLSFGAWKHCRPAISPLTIASGCIAFLGCILSLSSGGRNAMLPAMAVVTMLLAGILVWRHRDDAEAL